MNEKSLIRVPRAFRIGHVLTIVIVILATTASAVGLLMPDIYRDAAWVVPQNRGTDLITLFFVVPALAVNLWAVRRGSARALMMWIGLLGYVFYVYTGASFAYAFNELFLVYVALYSLSIFALLTAGLGLDESALRRQFDENVPRKSVAVFLIAIGMMLAFLWLRDIIPFIVAGVLPESIRLARVPTMFVYVLDLGLIVPIAFLAAAWLWRGYAWGYILAGVVLIKAATMGLALLTMTWFAHRAGIVTQPELIGTYAVIALGGLGLSVWFFRHCRS